MIENKRITDTGSTASLILMRSNTVKNVNIKSRECIRIAGGGDLISGAETRYKPHIIKGCYLEANGSGADHADVIQTYFGGSGGHFSLIVEDTCVKLGMEAANTGLFVADYCNGDVIVRNTVFWGGPYGCKIHPDSNGGNVISFKDVYFVGPFGWGEFIINKSLNGNVNIIKQWENVRKATISNGKLVPGEAIPRPF